MPLRKDGYNTVTSKKFGGGSRQCLPWWSFLKVEKEKQAGCGGDLGKVNRDWEGQGQGGLQ